MAAAGILPYQELKEAAEGGAVTSPAPVTEEQVQPASLDLRLGRRAYRLRASFLPGPNATVLDRLPEFIMHTIELTPGAIIIVRMFDRRPPHQAEE